MSGSKRTRLTDSAEFERVYRQGTAYRGRLFSVHTFPNELKTARLGLSVSKKVGNAVIRNKVRRRLKEIFRAAAPGTPGFDVVVSARPASADASYEELRMEFQSAVHRIETRDRTRR